MVPQQSSIPGRSAIRYPDPYDLDCEWRASHHVYRTSGAAKELRNIVERATKSHHIDRIVVLGLDAFNGTQRNLGARYFQLSMIMDIRSYLAECNGKPPVKIYLSDPCHFQEIDEAFLEELSSNIELVEESDIIDHRPKTLKGITNFWKGYPGNDDPNSDEKESTSFFNSDVSGVSDLITPSTLFFAPCAPFEPNLRALQHISPAMIIGHSSKLLRSLMEWTDMRLSDNFPEYKDQFKGNPKVVATLENDYSSEMFNEIGETTGERFDAFIRKPESIDIN